MDFYIELPKVIGTDNNGNDVVVGVGRFGPYVLCEKRFYSYKKTPFHEITLEDAMDIIDALKNKPKRAFGKSTKKTKQTVTKSESNVNKTKSKTKTSIKGKKKVVTKVSSKKKRA